MFASMSLKAKLLTMCVALAAMTAGLSVVNSMNLDSVVTAYSHIGAVNLPNTINLANMRVEFKTARLRGFRAGLEGVDVDERHKVGTSINNNVVEYEKWDKAYTDLDFQAGEKELYDAVDHIWDEHKVTLEAISKLALIDTPEAHAELVKHLNGEFVAVANRYDPAMQKLVDYQEKQAALATAAAEDAAKISARVSFSIAAATIFSSLLIGFLISRSLSTNLAGIAANLSSGAAVVASAAQQISGASTEAASATTQQAAALQQTVASVDEVNAMVGKNADNAKRSLDVAINSKEAAMRGKAAVDDMLTSIDEISRSNTDIMQQTEASNQEISAIVKIIAEIGNKTKVINDIVFQTKLLSFNASVEAARAGEHGKGFAVVAEEVGNLAQMSGNAAKEISQMLEASIQKVERTVVDTKTKLDRLVTTGRDKVEAGTVTARRCGEALDDIVRQVGDLNHMVSEIATASREQAVGVQEISKALGQIDQGMQQNAAVASESAAASEDLTAQAVTLDTLVNSLVGMVHGEGSQLAAPPKPAPRIAARKPTTSAKVVPFKKKAVAAPRKVESQGLRLAVGGSDLPGHDDSRFEDV